MNRELINFTQKSVRSPDNKGLKLLAPQSSGHQDAFSQNSNKRPSKKIKVNSGHSNIVRRQNLYLEDIINYHKVEKAEITDKKLKKNIKLLFVTLWEEQRNKNF